MASNFTMDEVEQTCAHNTVNTDALEEKKKCIKIMCTLNRDALNHTAFLPYPIRPFLIMYNVDSAVVGNMSAIIYEL